jgi:glutathione S-transferase
MKMPVLYSFPLSANGYRARLVLDFLGVSFESRTIDLSKGEHVGPDFLKINPLGQVPVFVDGDLVVSDSHAIAAYVADRYRGPAAEGFGRAHQQSAHGSRSGCSSMRSNCTSGSELRETITPSEWRRISAVPRRGR